MRLALWQTQGFGADKERNLASLSRAASAAAAGGADLLLCPECWLGGYHVEAAAIAEPADGPAAQAVARLAADHKIAIVYGYAEQERRGIFNSAMAIGPDGRQIGHYRKTHLFGDFERRQYVPGDGLAAPFRFGAWTIGLLICYDVEFPEAVRALALAGADLLLAPTALTPEYHAVPAAIVPARAVENQMFVAYCNHAGVEHGLAYHGGSCVAAPDGNFLVRAGAGESLLFAEIDQQARAEAASLFPYLRDRRPALYAAEIKNAP